MTVSLNGNDIGQIVEIALAVGGILAMLIAGLVFYLLVRPPRKAKIPSQQPPRPDALDPDEVIEMLDRMEERLGVLERAVGRDEEPRRIAAAQEELIETGVESPEMGRK